jgi:hypothetical protein
MEIENSLPGDKLTAFPRSVLERGQRIVCYTEPWLHFLLPLVNLGNRHLTAGALLEQQLLVEFIFAWFSLTSRGWEKLYDLCSIRFFSSQSCIPCLMTQKYICTLLIIHYSVAIRAYLLSLSRFSIQNPYGLPRFSKSSRDPSWCARAGDYCVVSSYA